MRVELEVSLYPLTKEYLEYPVQSFIELLERHGCEVERAPVGSVARGESASVFEALRLGYEQAVQKCGCVLIVKACNVCPL